MIIYLKIQNSYGQADTSFDLMYEEIKPKTKYLKNGTSKRVTKRPNPRVKNKY